jgi:hypothetical protein
MNSSFAENVGANTTTMHTFVGYVYLLGSSLLWGSNFLPVKHFETGDGMFFQLIVGLAIWTVGLVVQVLRGFPNIYVLPVLSGILWATGNVNTVPIIKSIGWLI